jgi:predicted MPP superfamily phosphohydrolase
MILGLLSSWMVSSWCLSDCCFAVKGLLTAVLLVYSQCFWLTYVLTSGDESRLSEPVSFITSLSAPWLALSLFFFVLLCLLSLFKVIPDVNYVRMATGFCAIVIVLLMMAYGVWNVQTPQIKRYEVTARHIEKPMDIVVLSDFHFGNLDMTCEKMRRTADIVQLLKPDLILIPGDILDGSAAPLSDDKLMREFSRLKAPLGTVAVPGNHDVYGGVEDVIAAKLKKLGMKFLRDESLDIKGGMIRIAGRRDASFDHGKTPRKTLTELLSGAKPRAFTVVMDHTPAYFDEAAKIGADFQVSGHTHNGQYFPVNLVVKLIYKDPWGLFKKDGSTLFTSCGIGTWGAPLRIGSIAEIALLHIVPEK